MRRRLHLCEGEEEGREGRGKRLLLDCAEDIRGGRDKGSICMQRTDKLLAVTPRVRGGIFGREEERMERQPVPERGRERDKFRRPPVIRLMMQSVFEQQSSQGEEHENSALFRTEFPSRLV